MTQTLNYISEILIQNAGSINPILSPLSLSYGSVGDGTTILDLPNIALSIGNIVSTSIGNVFSSIWDWLFYNLISPFLIIGFIAIFFATQYYLIRFYYLFAKNFFGKSLKLYSTIIESDKFKKIITRYEKIIN